jgi:DNA-binding winged helix-turn-helix (wHTH) protein/pimeloyl-ACP methyl ester carboxylesterase
MEQVLGFSRYRFELETGRLWSGKREIKLTPKASAVLKELVMRAGKPVTKEELFASVWKDAVVSDDALTSCVQELRRALADNVKRPRFIETRYRRGYRFVARLFQATAEDGADSPLPTSDMRPRLHYAESGALNFACQATGILYARSGGVNIAYQVVGAGPIDLVVAPGYMSHLEQDWRWPDNARFIRRLASFARVILFDRRGTGLSDRFVPTSRFDEVMDDIAAVMDAAGSTRAALLGGAEGGPMCILFAAAFPKRTHALVLVASYARRMWAPDYPWGSARPRTGASSPRMRSGGVGSLSVSTSSRRRSPTFRASRHGTPPRSDMAGARAPRWRGTASRRKSMCATCCRRSVSRPWSFTARVTACSRSSPADTSPSRFPGLDTLSCQGTITSGSPAMPTKSSMRSRNSSRARGKVRTLTVCWRPYCLRISWAPRNGPRRSGVEPGASC